MAEHDHGLTADAATLTQCPDEYWCVADDGWAQYFWREQTVTREEYLANSGKEIAHDRGYLSQGASVGSRQAWHLLPVPER